MIKKIISLILIDKNFNLINKIRINIFRRNEHLNAVYITKERILA